MSDLKALLKGAATIFNIAPAPLQGSIDIREHFRDLVKQGMSRNTSEAFRRDADQLAQDFERIGLFSGRRPTRGKKNRRASHLKPVL